MKCKKLKTPKATIQGTKYFQDGIYWGEIIEKTETYIKVECRNNNRYMQGEIITVMFKNTSKHAV